MMKDKTWAKIRELAEYILMKIQIQDKTITGIKTIEIKIIFRKKRENNLKMNKINLKKEIKISKMIMMSKMKKEMVVETIEKTKIECF